VPLAEIKTAGVIMAVNTPSDAVRASMLESVAVHSSDFEPARPIRYARLWRAGLRNPESAYDLAQFCLNFNSTQPPSTPEECVPNFMIFSALRIVAENRYHFVDRWRVEGDLKEVADILEDALALPGWWGSVYFDVKEIEPGGEGGIGKLISLHAGGWLPYTLRINFRTIASNYPHGFSMDATGDLEGLGIWTFEQDGDFVNVTYDWTIRANKRIIEKLSFLLKPIFRSNHNWTMKRGAESLRLELLRRRAKSDEELASIPAGPRPSFVVRILGLNT